MSSAEFEPSIALRMTQSQAREFLERLEWDDEFRGRLTEAPRDVFAEYGIEVAEELVPEQVTLPEKEQIADLHAAIEGTAELRIPIHGAIMWPGILFVFAIAKQRK
jgi:hypothetical protein